MDFQAAAQNLFGLGVHRPLTGRFFADKLFSLRNNVKSNLLMKNILVICQSVIHINLPYLPEQLVHRLFAIN